MKRQKPLFKVGDPCPEGYGARIEWNETHHKAGLKQARCSLCLLWHWPHEIDSREIQSTAYKRNGTPVIYMRRVCKKCAAKRP